MGNIPAIPVSGHAHLFAWLGDLGRLFSKGRRLAPFELLEDGRVRIVIEYPTIADLLYVLREIDALRAIAHEAAAAKAEAGSSFPGAGP